MQGIPRVEDDSFKDVEGSPWLIAHSALPEGCSLVPSTHIMQLTITCNSSSRGGDSLLDSMGSCTHVHVPKYTTHN